MDYKKLITGIKLNISTNSQFDSGKAEHYELLVGRSYKPTCANNYHYHLDSFAVPTQDGYVYNDFAVDGKDAYNHIHDITDQAEARFYRDAEKVINDHYKQIEQELQTLKEMWQQRRDKVVMKGVQPSGSIRQRMKEAL
jgi:hypothetical protein